MAGRRIKNEEEARRFLRAIAASGVSQGHWVREHGIDGRSLQAWRMILEKRQRKSSALQLVELVPSTRPTRAQYRVHCGGFVVEVDDNFSDQVLGCPIPITTPT